MCLVQDPLNAPCLQYSARHAPKTIRGEGLLKSEKAWKWSTSSGYRARKNYHCGPLYKPRYSLSSNPESHKEDEGQQFEIPKQFNRFLVSSLSRLSSSSSEKRGVEKKKRRALGSSLTQQLNPLKAQLDIGSVQSLPLLCVDVNPNNWMLTHSKITKKDAIFWL